MSGQKRQFLKVPYGAYHNDPIPEENIVLTHVEKGSKAGELLRRYWQPLCLASEVGELPLKTRMFGEDLVVFRTRENEVGILDLHCSHRGSSLEFGMRESNGLRWKCPTSRSTTATKSTATISSLTAFTIRAIGCRCTKT
jgi:hypothetical protein